ncbi:MAG: hypothetical protein ACI4M6_03690 [Christensenellaceae bacterium]
MTKPDKILSYIGFAIKSGNVRTGVNVAKTIKKPVPLMILCHTASKNTVEEVLTLSKKLNSKIIVTKDITVEDIFNKQNCKLAVITSNELAKAIITNTNEHFVLLGDNC